MMDWRELVKIAEDWQAKGEPGREMGARRCAVQEALREAVRKSPEEGPACLKQSGLSSQLERIAAIADQHGIAHENVDLADLANVIGRLDLSRKLLELSKEPWKFWAEYRKAQLALLEGKPYRAPQGLKLKGWVSTFGPLLSLAEALAGGGDVQAATAAVDAGFQKRNADKRMFDPAGIDGDGNLPVRWDLRKQSMLAAAKKV